MRIFKNRWFIKWARQKHISDALLCGTIMSAEDGQVDADYGGGVIKQRIARKGSGKSSGYRTVVLYRRGDKAFFVYGFSKSAKANIDAAEEKAFKGMAEAIFGLSDTVLVELIERGTYQEVKCHG